MNLAIASKEPTHYKRALIQYATHISQQNMRPRLKEVSNVQSSSILNLFSYATFFLDLFISQKLRGSL